MARKEQPPSNADLARLYPQPVRGSNLYDLDRDLQRALARRLGKSAGQWRDNLVRFGAFAGGAADAEAEFTDRHAPPVLEPYDREGRLINVIRTNPLWDQTSCEVYRQGIVGLNYGATPAPFAITFVMGYLLSQANLSLHCPATMTGAVAYVLDRWGPAALKAQHLHALIRMDGKAVSAGTWVTEHHGGSDVGATTTRAEQVNGQTRLTGLKWFTSNANGGLALATARPAGAPDGTAGLGLYLVPLVRADGTSNALRLRRLKDKLGTKGVATAEIDLEGADAYEVAPPPQGFKLMMEALNFSRIHNAVSGAAVQRRALLEALGYARDRQAFGHRIIHYAMVQDEILKILAPCEASLALALEAALAFDAADAKAADAPERIWTRVVTALAKYLTAEDAVAAARRALEIIGGNGYTQDYVTARLVRDAQVLTVWEGPANIQALELLRLLDDRKGGAALYATRIRTIVTAARDVLGAYAARITTALTDIEAALALIVSREDLAARHARRLLALMADVLAAALLLEAAAHDARDGDFRKAVVLRLFIDERLSPPDRRGILPGREWMSAIFEPLVAYDEIPALPAAIAH